MPTLKQTAENYVPKKTLNITELPSIDISEPIETREGVNADGDKYKYDVLVRDGVDYRLPASVTEGIQNLLLNMKDLTTVKVTKTGEGLKTKYTVIPITNSMEKVMEPKAEAEEPKAEEPKAEEPAPAPTA